VLTIVACGACQLTARILAHGVLGLDGHVKQQLRIVRVGQPMDAKTGDSSADDIQRVTLEYLVDRKR
jgi:hypothetical protein